MSDIRRKLMMTSVPTPQSDWYRVIKGIASDGNAWIKVTFFKPINHNTVVMDFAVTITDTYDYVRRLYGWHLSDASVSRTSYIGVNIEADPVKSSWNNVPSSIITPGANPIYRVTDFYNQMKNNNHINRKMILHVKVADSSQTKKSYMYFEDEGTKYYFNTDDAQDRASAANFDFPIFKALYDSGYSGDCPGCIIHYLTVRNNGTTASFDLIPVILTKNITADMASDSHPHYKNELGMVDLISGKFLGNVGTGNFIGQF